jgi:predicted transcriptional regulator YdeE
MSTELNEQEKVKFDEIRTRRQYDEFAILVATKDAQRKIIEEEVLRQKTPEQSYHFFDQDQHQEPVAFITKSKRDAEEHPSQ